MILFKVIILGDAATGKTSLMNNFLGEPFRDTDCPTIGVEFGSHSDGLKDIMKDELLEKFKKYIKQNPELPLTINTPCKLQIWNSSGQERFHSIITSYYRNVQGVIFVCDLTRINTLEHLTYWINDYERNGTKTLKEVGACIVANKSDLTDYTEIYESDLQTLAERYQIPYFIVSSKLDRDKIKLVFNNLMNQMFEKYMSRPADISDPTLINLRLNQPPNQSSYLKRCC